MSEKLGNIVTQQERAYDRYESTKDVSHIKTVIKCLDERKKILQTKLKKMKTEK